VSEDGECDEDIDVEAPRIPRNKSGGWRLTGAGTRRPFHPDCEYGEIVHPSEKGAESSVVPTHPPNRSC